MKKVTSLLLCLLLCLPISACSNDGAKDIIGEYANKIEDSKDELEKGLGELQDVVDEVMKGGTDK